MSWRTVVIEKRCKLDYKMGYMVVRDSETKRVFLDEIAILLIENPAVSLTGCLIEALAEKKVRVIFCDSRRSPLTELVPYHGSHNSADRIRMQIRWKDETKALIWQKIIREKIRLQAAHLGDLKKQREYDLLCSYIDQVEPPDATNREGHAAKVYFNALFGMDFTRGADRPENAALNYGYSVILSAFNREIALNGYLTQLGIFHDNQFNHFNLSSDLMEPFRILIDRKVVAMQPRKLEREEKHALWKILGDTVVIDQSKQVVLNAIKVYCGHVFDALNSGDVSGISFYERL
ncbi:MAG: type II CRISPR-associated endonuclease Cas1 [Christensenellales bacterium]|jgi:CRISPR-associated protein Cas1